MDRSKMGTSEDVRKVREVSLRWFGHVTTEKIYGCSEGGHSEGWRDRDIEADDLLWHPINGAAERRRNLPM